MNILYNGIQLSNPWPPESNEKWFGNGREPMAVPYLSPSGIPAVIPIDIGRQLFVDDFLIEETTLQRVLHKPKKYEGNPIVVPERDYEQSSVYFVGEPVIWDPEEKIFKLWYSPGHWIASRALLLSKDGINWQRPKLDVDPPTNIVMPEHSGLAIVTIIYDYEEDDPSRRYKAHGWDEPTRASVFLTSSDGIHWNQEGVWKNKFDDTTNIFYNPFRKKWIYNPKIRQRARGYAEFDKFEDLFDKNQVEQTVMKWYRADALDDRSSALEDVDKAQIYDLFAMPYESIMLGSINVWYGPENNICEENKIPKHLQIHMGYSRDGFHWHRPTHEPFIPSQRNKGIGHPEFGYLRPAGSILNVVGDKLHFYYMAASGISKDGEHGVYTGITINMATMRRDGFASMEACSTEGTLTTRPVLFKGKYLFVNVDCPEGELLVEVLDEEGHIIEPFSRANCKPVSADSTSYAITWKGAKDLFSAAEKPIRFRFHLKQGKLYAFWVSPDKTGASYGYMAGGGPDLTGATDSVGQMR